MKLKDKVALITGGGRGIGLEIATLFAKEGAKLVLCDVDESSLSEARDSMGLSDDSILTLKVDVTDASMVEGVVAEAVKKFSRIDILINNAGITRDGLMIRMKEEDWDLVLDINLKGAFICTKGVAKVMMKQRSGKIINMASIIGRIGNLGQANYSASKGGLIALTKTTAKELAARNINCNAIAPGFIQTKMTDKLSEDVKNKMLELIPLNRFGNPKDVASLAVFLASEDSDYITGQTITVDGGMVMS